MEFTQLISTLGQASSLVLDVTAELLRFCRAHAGALRNDMEHAGYARDFAAQRKDAAKLLKEKAKLRSEALRPEDLAELAVWLREAAKRTTPLLAVRACAEGLDAGFGQRFETSFRGRELEVAEGEPIPIARINLRSIFERLRDPAQEVDLRPATERLGTDPDKVDSHVDRVTSLTLMPATAGLRVVLSGVHADALATLTRGARIGAAIPNTHLDSFEWDTDAEKTSFYGVRVKPVEREEHVRRVRRLLQLTLDLGLHVVVFPELTIDEALLEEVRQTLSAREPSARPLLVVAGSRHLPVKEGEPGTNEATALLRSMAELRHQKFRPYVGPVGKVGTERLDVRRPTLRVHLSGSWTVVLLICKDLLDDATLTLLTGLQARLVLVPSLSETTEDYITDVRRLAQHSRSTVVVANVHHLDHTHEALFGRPTRAPLEAIQGRPGARLHVMTLGDGRLTPYEA